MVFHLKLVFQANAALRTVQYVAKSCARNLNRSLESLRLILEIEPSVEFSASAVWLFWWQLNILNPQPRPRLGDFNCMSSTSCDTGDYLSTFLSLPVIMTSLRLGTVTVFTPWSAWCLKKKASWLAAEFCSCQKGWVEGANNNWGC